MPCPLCSVTTNVLFRGEYWTVVLNDDQGYLGRCYFALNRHETDLTNLSAAERDALWAHFSAIKEALNWVWEPDHYNYVFLMNLEPHLHGHIIPRYAAPRSFDGIDFIDGALGKHYDIANVQVPPAETLSRIANEIRSALTLSSEAVK